VPAARLDARQAAWLAAILPSPRRYERGISTAYVESRIATLRRHMSYAQIP
jgi:membrane peptidoglycan carboxypeptidase